MGFFDNKIVTIFNRFFNPETEEEKYYPTVLDSVDIVETRGANITNSGMNSADAVKLYVDFDNLTKPYIAPKEWDALPEDIKTDYITFHPDEDFFVRGDHTNELQSERVYEWFRDNVDSVYKISTVDKYEDVLPHFEVGGV